MEVEKKKPFCCLVFAWMIRVSAASCDNNITFNMFLGSYAMRFGQDSISGSSRKRNRDKGSSNKTLSYKGPLNYYIHIILKFTFGSCCDRPLQKGVSRNGTLVEWSLFENSKLKREEELAGGQLS
jgi:hypothetical protein